MSRTDKERLDFLQAQRFTKWVGCDTIQGGKHVAPVFGHEDIRAAIDYFMDKSEEYRKLSKP